MKRILLLVMFVFTLIQGHSQTRGISYQAVILSPNEQQIPGQNAQDNILANSQVVIQFTIINAASNEEYQEYHTTSTDKYGMINLLIGAGTSTSTNDFSDISWNGTLKKLEVAIDFSGNGSNFIPLSEQNLSYMPQPANDETTKLLSDNAAAILTEKNRALAAEAILTTSVNTNAATNTSAISTLESEQTIQNAAIALNTEKAGITAGQAAIIAVTSGTNTGDQDISGIAINASDISDLQTEQTTQNTAIALNTAKVGITAEQATIVANTSGLNTGDQDISGIAVNTSDISDLQTEQTTQNTAIALNTTKVGITAEQATIVANTSGINTGDQDISGIATNATAIALKEDKINKSIDVAIDAASDTKYPSVKAVKTYVDAISITGSPATATNTAAITNNSTTIGINTGAIITNATDILLKEDKTNKSVNVATDGASDVKYPSVKAIKDYVDANILTDTDDLSEGSTNLYFTDARVSANTDVAANTLKVGITSQQASDITANNTKTGITTQQASDIVANNAKVGYTDALVSANTDVAANTLKTGITTQQASDITANNAKTGITAQQASDIVANNAKVSYTDASAVALNTAKETNATHTGDVTGATALTIGDGKVTDAKITAMAASKLTGAVAIANGGTGATTKAAAFNALSPMTAAGDIIYGGASGTGTVLTKGTANQVLTMNAGATAPIWTSSAVASINGLSDGKVVKTTSMFLGENAGIALDGTLEKYNTGIGVYALNKILIGSDNTAVGYKSMENNLFGNSNSAFGNYALRNSIAGSKNTAIGHSAGHGNTGSNNIFLGYNSGFANISGTGNVFLGYLSGSNETGSNKLFIENTVNSTPLIYGEFDNDLVRINGKQEITGTLKIEGGTPGLGKVLTSDAAGLASWATPSSGPATTDALSEGSTNLYYTDARVAANADVAAKLTGNAAITGATKTKVTYDAKGLVTAGADATTADIAEGTNLYYTDARVAANADVVLNSAKVTNVTHTGDVTGATALTIGDDKILEKHLKSVNAATDEYALTYESTTGDFEWQAIATNINGLADGKTSTTSLFLGVSAGAADNNGAGNRNTAVGISSLMTNTSGIFNTAVGNFALRSNTGNNNTAVGAVALVNSSTGFNNTAVGASAQESNTTGLGNTALGFVALQANTTGNSNTVIGSGALQDVTGSNNTALGSSAGQNNLTGSNNVFIGGSAGFNETGSNKLYIANSNTATPLIYGEFDTNLLRINGKQEITGTLKIEGGTPGLGKVLTSDAAGLASWVTPSSGPATTDALSEGSTNLYYTDARVAANADVAAKLTGNAAITGATKTKVTYDAKGLVTAGTDATTADIAASTDKNYVTDAQLTDITDATDANTASTLVKRDASGNFSAGTITADLTGNATNVSGVVAIANGGTGATTKAAAFDALSPMSAAGDVIYGGATGTGTVLTKGTAGQVLAMNVGATAPEWKTSATGATSIDELSDAKTLNTNLVLGAFAGNLITTANANVLLGNSAGQNMLTGQYNVAIGLDALKNNQSGGRNTVIGYGAGNAVANYSKNIIIGFQAATNETGSDKLFIGNGPNALISGDMAAFSLSFNTANTTIYGSLKLPNMNAGAGKVLTSDAAGIASWQTPSSGSSSLVTKTANYTITATDKYVIATTGGITITLPTAVGVSGTEYTIKNMAAANVTIATTSSQQIWQDAANMATTATLGIESQNNWIKVVSDGTNWISFRALY